MIMIAHAPPAVIHRRAISQARAMRLSAALIRIYGMPEGYGIESAGGVDYSGSTWRAKSRRKLFTIETEARRAVRSYFLTIDHTS